MNEKPYDTTYRKLIIIFSYYRQYYYIHHMGLQSVSHFAQKKFRASNNITETNII
jgi:hypothetical protein